MNIRLQLEPKPTPQALFVGVFALQSWRSYGIPEKADRHPLFVVMTVACVMGLGAMIALKPKSKKKVAGAKDA